MLRIIFCFLLIASSVFSKTKTSFRAEPATENGVPVSPKVFYEKNPSALTTTLSVIVMTGSVDDPVEKSGLSNIVAEIGRAHV